MSGVAVQRPFEFEAKKKSPDSENFGGGLRSFAQMRTQKRRLSLQISVAIVADEDGY